MISNHGRLLVLASRVREHLPAEHDHLLDELLLFALQLERLHRMESARAQVLAGDEVAARIDPWSRRVQA